MEQSATELQTFSQLKKQEDTAIPRRQEVHIMMHRRISNIRNSDHSNNGQKAETIYHLCVCVLGPAGGRGEADGERERTSAEIWRAADGEGGSAQQCSEILSSTH